MKKRILAITISTLALSAILVVILLIGGCSSADNNSSTPDEAVTETKIETVTAIATDEQGSTFIEEATKVVEVRATEKADEPTEKETNDNEKFVAENRSESSKTTSDNSSKTDTSSNKTTSSSIKSESSNKNSSTNKNTSSSNSSSSTTNKSNSSTSTNKNNSSSSSTTSKPSSSSSSTTSNKAWHEAEYEYINHPAVTEKVWVVDKEAYIYEEPVYEKKVRTICLECGEDITENALSHSKNHALKGENGAYSNKKVEVQVGTKTVTVPEEGHWETKIIKEAWTEKKLVREAGYY